MENINVRSMGLVRRVRTCEVWLTANQRTQPRTTFCGGAMKSGLEVNDKVKCSERTTSLDFSCVYEVDGIGDACQWLDGSAAALTCKRLFNWEVVTIIKLVKWECGGGVVVVVNVDGEGGTQLI
eukprot:6475285-Amphidinium_carterae.1